MESPVNGSTAPPVTPSLAWPSRPVERSSPLSTPSCDTPSSSFCSTRQGSSNTLTSNLDMADTWRNDRGEDKADAPEVRVVGEDAANRRYPPPRNPLTPNQLGRIAQSFGIVIPSLPHPSPTYSPSSAPSSSSRHPMSIQPTRATPYLLTIIPPLNLQSSTHATNPDDAKDRARRWRRGRLLPLQPTMGSMLLCIAREYGLPSTVGLGMYLVQPGLPLGSTSSSSSYDEPAGPLISPQTWSSLFSSYLVNSTNSSRATTPVHTPVRPAGPLGRDIAFPPSPLSLVDKRSKKQRERLHSFTMENRPPPPSTKPRSPAHTHSAKSSTSSNVLPPTPGSSTTHRSLTNMIVGTIEFDVDPGVATWLDEWRRTGNANRHRHQRKMSGISDSGVGGNGRRQLRLVRKVINDKNKSIRDIILGGADVPEIDHFGATPDTTLVADSDDMSPSTTSDFGLTLNRADGRLSITEMDLDHAMSVSASFDRFSEQDDSMEVNTTKDVEREMRDVVAMLTAGSRENDDLLASPIELDRAQLNREKLLKVLEAKRGSGLVMADELDDLERLMKTLCPRDIRIISPRTLTPRMNAKVAAARVQAANLALPVPSARSNFRPSTAPSTSPNPAFGKARTESAGEQTRPNVDLYTDKPLPSWPAVPFGSSRSPKLEDMFRDQSDKTLSTETTQRMGASSKRTYDEWRPTRPPRPKSPDLDLRKALSHSLSPVMLEHLRSPPMPVSTITADEPKQRMMGRSGSVSFRGLKNQISGKNLNLRWTSERDSEKDSEKDTTREPVGFIKNPVEEEPSSFVSLRQEKVNEYGKIDEHATPSSKNGITHRLFNSSSFSFGRKNNGSHLPPDLKRGGATRPGSRGSRRNPSLDGSIKISSPIVSSFQKIDGANGTGLSSMPMASPIVSYGSMPGSGSLPGANAGESLMGHNRRPSGGIPPASPQSPASPKSVKRKPVPGYEVRNETDIVPELGLGLDGVGGVGPGMNNESLASMASFVLDAPPRKKLEG